MIKGYATINGTNEYFSERKIIDTSIRKCEYFKSLPIAMGNHLGDFSDEDTEKYIEAMIYGLENGVNFIDTAINYRGMRSEKDVGTALNYVINKKKSVKRDEIIISTKGGQVFGDYTIGIRPIDYLNNILLPQGILKEEELNIVDDARFTLAPKFYEKSIEISRNNLGLETIDIHYIHNPEVSMFLLGKERFYKELKELFEFYEGQVEKGYIRFYGMATWDAFLVDEDSPCYISMEEVMKLAKEVAGEANHFRFIQMPYNIYRMEANIKKNQKVLGEYRTPIEAAVKLGLTVTISSPLNAGKIEKDDDVDNMLSFVTNTEGVYAAMVGCKSKEHLMRNINS